MTRNNHNGENITVFDHNDGTYTLTLVSRKRVFRQRTESKPKQKMLNDFDSGYWVAFDYQLDNALDADVEDMWRRFYDVEIRSDATGTEYYLDGVYMTHDQVNIYFDIAQEKGLV